MVWKAAHNSIFFLVEMKILRLARHWLAPVAVACGLIGLGSPALAQAAQPEDAQAGRQSAQPLVPVIKESPEARAKADALISEMIEPELTIDVDPRYSKILRTKKPVGRISITHPDILEVVQFSPTEFELIGQGTGQTTLTFWFGGAGEPGEILRYQVRVAANQVLDERRKAEYADLERMVNEMFPNSFVQLTVVADKLIVRGQARDARESEEIFEVIGSGGGVNRGGGSGGNNIRMGSAVRPYGGGSTIGDSTLINMLEIPGEMQVMLKVRVAELNRSAARNIGADLAIRAGDFSFITGLLGGGGASGGLGGLAGGLQTGGGSVTAILNTDDVNLTLSALSSNAYSKILAEPNLVTLSGHSASFHAGGEFAVPTVVGVGGASAVSTEFRGFGTSLSFTPTVLDKDRIRLQVSPTLSSPSGGSVNGIPSLSSRNVTTTVDLREGQWLAIAGLILDEQQGGKVRVPGLGDIPILDTIFSRRTISRGETELLVLVSPELVHPLEAEEAPLILPGMEVTEPGDVAFFLGGYYEGRPGCEHRSTVWPIMQREMFEARREAKRQVRYQKCTERYIEGAHGFTR